VLFGASADGTYRVMVNYMEDCASLPSGLLSAILGISIDLILTGIIGAPIGVSPGQISDVIDDICFDHDSSAVTITISINGMIIREVTTSLSRKGDYQYPVDLVRQNGQFMVR